MKTIKGIFERKEQGVFIVEYSISGSNAFFAFGVTRKAALEMFLADLESSWEVIALEEDQKLVGSARQFKQELLKLKESGIFDELLTWAKVEILKESGVE